MKFDYSKTINEQLPTFEYYKDRYCSYELELLKDRKEIERLNNKLELINKIVEREFPRNEFITYKIKKILKGSDKE